MISAELNHNPYLLSTAVKFNGQDPKINSQIEKYEKLPLKDWVHLVPEIFYNEMNGYDFNLYFIGTKPDYEDVKRAFAARGISEENVRISHKNEIEDADTKSKEVDALVSWLKNTPNRKFDFDDFWQKTSEIFEGSYPYVMIRGSVPSDTGSLMSFERVENAIELKNTDLTSTPIVFYIDEETKPEFRRDLDIILKRKDVRKEQLFFMISPMMDRAQVKRVICDLGVEKPQVINNYKDDSVMMYIRNYPITEFIRSATYENKAITEMMSLLDQLLKKTNEYDSYGMWNVAGYFVSDDMSTAEIAASNYRSLMNGENTGREVSAVNSWRINNDAYLLEEFHTLTTYLSRYAHPQFVYYNDATVSAATAVSGKELGLHLGLPRASVPGLPVIEHAEFGKEVTTYQLFPQNVSLRPEDRMTLGKVFDLGQITNKVVELDNKSLNMHTFITGSTGSGKSNTVYQMLSEMHQDRIPFLVVEPAKGEYKDVFGNWDDVRVYSTNPKVAELINLNPFKFPDSIHVLEHVDGLVEIFSVCWPMYDAMPAFLKDAILKSYELVGWDLGSSTFEGDEVEYPDFEILAEQLERLIDDTEYSAEVKGNYTGALVTRVKSLTVGLNKFIFTTQQTPYEYLFDQNCILDISRVKSGETKALIMGLMVYILNEYRVDQKTSNNSGLKHVTVLEEAHNLLKNTAGGGESELVGKSVEMLTQTIAEIRTYGEGFIIVDQSPSSVDIAAIKNTNTKIVLRTPEANDREAVGRSMGLTPNQVNEIAKLPSGVAVVYQNNWVNPVLTMIDKANVTEKAYVNDAPIMIKSIRESRTNIIRAIMEPWLPGDMIEFSELARSINSLEVSRSNRKLLSVMACTYRDHRGHMIWNVNSMNLLKQLLFDILGISQKTIANAAQSGNPDLLRREVMMKTINLAYDEIEEICHVLTMEV